MFGDLMGNLEAQQAEVQKKLALIQVEESMDGVTITGNATKQITNISISLPGLTEETKEMLEDIILSCFNRYIDKAQKREAEETQKLMEDLMPPGFKDMFK
ncbi:MAG: YbaB/EbfC family nucleoid-associated protein [Saprospiraceae bacterium]|nr:YbaB/EbfC family nucleoid-associated protein [Saprospiraceae bacterium]